MGFSTATLSIFLQTCAPMVAPSTMYSVITIESGSNPYAIGVVKGQLQRQPRNINEAIATAQLLDQLGMNYSVGVAQVNKHNFKKYGLTLETAFDPCTNLNAGGKILHACYIQSIKTKNAKTNTHLARAFSCYYSGQLDSSAGHDYARKIFAINQRGNRQTLNRLNSEGQL